MTVHRLPFTLHHPPLSPGRNLHPLDLATVVAYLAAVTAIGIRAGRGQRTATDYFLGARDLPALAVLFSIVATETSALTVISVPGIGFKGDLTFLQLAFGYVVGRIGVAAWLLPGYFRGSQETAYARLASRFGDGTRRLVSAVFLVTRFLGDGVRVFAGAIPLALLAGWSVPTAIVVMGIVTLVYTWYGGLRAVVWTDVLQLAIYTTGGVIALGIAVHLAGGAGAVVAAATAAGKLRVVVPHLSLTEPYTLLGGLVGGALLSAASHGTDHLIVQRLLATRSLRDAQRAIVGSGIAVCALFALFLLVGVAIWAGHAVPADAAGDQVFPQFVLSHLPAGIAGLVIAGILAASMGTHSSAISALASSVTHDLYATWTGRTDPGHLLRVGRGFALAWGVALILAALAFHAFTQGNTPVVVLALSIASVTYGGLLGTYILAGRWPRARGRDVVAGIAATVAVMTLVIFAARLAAWAPLGWLAPVGRLAWPWYVPLGTALTLAVAVVSSFLPSPRAER
ncbi:MAG TPA: sodium:solute symporter [Gemmatimonadales bacterium]|nr:sodium:solute symporter [Gemmatimonadales bacterium]